MKTKQKSKAPIPGTRGKPPFEIKGLKIEKMAIKAVSRSLKLPQSWSEALQEFDKEIQRRLKNPSDLLKRYGVKKVNKKFYAKVKVKDIK